MFVWSTQLFNRAPSATPTFSGTREWNIGNIGILSRFFGLDAGFRKKIIQLFDLGYASRLRLVFLVSTGFFLCYALIGTTVEIRIEAEEEDEDEEEVETDDNEDADEEEEDTDHSNA